MAYGASHDLADTLAKEGELQTLAGTSADHADAVRSFVAKERPVFNGR